MELLIVIAIIGILTSIVLAGLGGARERARNNSASASLQAVQIEAEIFFEQHSHEYTDLCTDSEIKLLWDKACTELGQSAGCGECDSDADNYGVLVPLIGGDYHCVDSTRESGESNAALVGNLCDFI